ncbi:MAG: GDSL-type esterase/lipase family protein [Gammaproteobacteria bacterium]|jgi:hypothetical protein
MPLLRAMNADAGRPGWRSNLLLILGSVVFSFLVGELAVRLWAGQPVFAWVDFSEIIVECASTHDPYAGWKPVPSRKGVDRARHPVTILADGLRSNGGPRPDSEQRILAVGDSYTFGGQVGDAETWPAALERRLGIPVLNGGVCGYGFGQTVLRALELTPRFRPDILIVGLIPTDIWRAQSSIRYSRIKPYFALENGAPMLKGVPLEAPQTEPGIAGIVQRAVDDLNDHSLLLRLLPDMRNYLQMFTGLAYVEAHQEGLEVSCALLGKIKELADRHGVAPYLLMQYKYRDIGNRLALVNGARPNPDDRNMEFLLKAIRLMECSRASGIPVIDTFPALQELHAEGGEDAVSALYFNHMNPAGNEFVADYIARQLGPAPGQRR